MVMLFYTKETCMIDGLVQELIEWKHKQVLVKHGGTYVRVHPSHLVPYPETYQSFSEDSKNEPNTLQKRPDESQKVPFSDDIDEDLETPDNVEQHPTVEAWDRAPNLDPKQDSTPKKTELPKPGQTIKFKLANDTDSEWRKLKVISRAGKATCKNRHLMNVVMEQGESFWLDFEHGVSEWQTSETEKHTSCDEENIMISSSNDNLELENAKKKELQSWVENKMYIQVPDQGQPKISTRWIYTNKNSNGKQTCLFVCLLGFMAYQPL